MWSLLINEQKTKKNNELRNMENKLVALLREFKRYKFQLQISHVAAKYNIENIVNNTVSLVTDGYTY